MLFNYRFLREVEGEEKKWAYYDEDKDDWALKPGAPDWAKKEYEHYYKEYSEGEEEEILKILAESVRDYNKRMGIDLDGIIEKNRLRKIAMDEARKNG